MSAWNDNKSNLVLILMVASGGGGGGLGGGYLFQHCTLSGIIQGRHDNPTKWSSPSRVRYIGY